MYVAEGGSQEACRVGVWGRRDYLFPMTLATLPGFRIHSACAATPASSEYVGLYPVSCTNRSPANGPRSAGELRPRLRAAAQLDHRARHRLHHGRSRLPGREVHAMPEVIDRVAQLGAAAAASSASTTSLTNVKLAQKSAPPSRIASPRSAQ